MIAADILEAVRELGGELVLEGNRLRYSLPDCPEARELLEQVRRDREAIKSLLRDLQEQAPSLEEIKASLPPGVRLLSYQPKDPPFAVAPVSVVTNAGKFYRSYLADLRVALTKPKGYRWPSVIDILAKLADAGLQLELNASGERWQPKRDKAQ